MTEALRHQPVADGAALRLALQVDSEVPEISPAEGLAGWHREFCVELLGTGAGRVFARVVQRSSFKATELQRALLFHRLDVRFTDLAGCVDALRADLGRLAATARRKVPCKANLFTTLDYDRQAWDRVEQGVDRWARR